MTDLPTPRFKIGDMIWTSGFTTKMKSRKCPECDGKGEWECTSPAGNKLTFTCPMCKPYSDAARRLYLPAYDIRVSHLTVGSIRIDTAATHRSKVEYMCLETGIGGGSIYYEDRCFETEEAARVVAKASAEEWLARELAKPEYKVRLEMYSYNLRDGLVAEAQQKASDMAYKLGDLKAAVEEALKELDAGHVAQTILEDAMKASNGG